MTDREGRFCGVFWGRGVSVRSASCFLPHQKMLIVARVIAGRGSAPVCVSVARAVFKCDLPRIAVSRTSESVFSYNFWAVVPELSGCVLGIVMERMIEPDFVLGL